MRTLDAEALPPVHARAEAAFMPQLDGLRAFAVLGVMAHHFLGDAWSIFAPVRTNGAVLGVRLFFVLSGFLITGILLRARYAVDAGATTRRTALWRFYLRRALRISPLYYLILLLAWVFGDRETHEQLPWLATYTYNYWMADLGWYAPHFAHFWSLAVEEQFYLVWPALILVLPHRALVPALIAVFASAPLYRMAVLVTEANGLWSYVALPANLDSLGAGALLAVVARGRVPSRALVQRMKVIGVAGLVGWLVVSRHAAASAVAIDSAITLTLAGVVAIAAARGGGILRRVLEARSVLYLGKISYGIYAYHALVPDVLLALAGSAAIGRVSPGLPWFLVCSSLSIGVAALSWHAFEAPINRLKGRFDMPGAV
jgi:peptidoglycan/LPS O-acetylase OafA/YrhL